jgi:MtN3 and saliva related transmembrane protein
MSQSTIDLIGYLAAVLGTLCWLPQVTKTIRTRNTADISLWSNVLLLGCIALWTIYGIAMQAWPIIIANGISGLLVGVILVMKLKHG